MNHALTVYLRDQQVGKLWLGEQRRFVFQYDEAWLKNEHAVPLSIALPLQAEAFDNDSARPFFANLLPESELRKIIARKLGLSEGNDFALLEALGGECAGAVSLIPEGDEPGKTGEYRPLNDDELNDLISELPRRPLLAGEKGIRLSLAGVQNKLPVFYKEDEGRVYLPTGNAASFHILKPPIQHLDDTVANETFSMQLAARMGLPVPRVTLLNKAQPLYLVNRYDREMTAEGKIIRQHQEDFCQAMAITPDMKYEKEGGPTLQGCFELLRHHSLTPILDIKALLNWVIFNYLIGNADAHGKNISLLHTDHGPVLAPFYDLMSTTVYPDLTDKLAMKIGGDDRPDWIIARRWQQFAEDIGVSFKIVHQTLAGMSKKIIQQSQALKQEFTQQHGACKVIDDIIAIIGQRAHKISSCLEAVNK